MRGVLVAIMAAVIVVVLIPRYASLRHAQRPAQGTHVLRRHSARRGRTVMAAAGAVRPALARLAAGPLVPPSDAAPSARAVTGVERPRAPPPPV